MALFFLVSTRPGFSAVVLTAGDGSGFKGSHYRPVTVSLDNPDERVKQVQLDVCDAGNYLSLNTLVRCETTSRSAGFSLIALDLPNGCTRIFMSSNEVPCPALIAKGSGPIFTINYNVAAAPPSGECRDLTPQNGSVRDEDGNLISSLTYGPAGDFCFSSCASAGDCNDGKYCNGTETCSGGVCNHNSVPSCTTECNSKCNEITGGYNCYSPAGTSCTNDGLFCNGTEVCNGSGSCIHPGNPCPAGTDCNETDEVCNCDLTDDCNDGLWCNGEEICFIDRCILTGDRCTDGYETFCDEANNKCVCCVNSECNDGQWCTGTETCNSGTCNDNIDPCAPPQVCDEGNDMCIQPDVTLTMLDGAGFIGFPGAEVDVRLANIFDKVNGVGMIICDENDYLTVSGCDEGSRTSGFVCEVNEILPGAAEFAGCASVLFYNDQPGTKLPVPQGTGLIFTLRFDVKDAPESDTGCNPFTIEDLEISDDSGVPLTSLGVPSDFCIYCLNNADCENNVCTDDSCGAGSLCVHTPNTASCNDGLYCTKTDRCSGGVCSGTGSPCATCQRCDEELTQCVTCTNDCDCDGVLNAVPDNCYAVQNGPLYGTCARTLGGVVVGTSVMCTSDGNCSFDAICEKDQEDFDANGIGDVCECYADITGPTPYVPDCKVNLSDLVLMKQEFNRTNCATVPCYADCNDDNKVNLSDLVIMKGQFNRTNCAPCS
jgi:hypothetical protein